MPEFKLTINDIKKGKSYKKVVSGSEADIFKRTRIKSKVSGDNLGFKGYEFEITGGSDNAGFPMRFDVEGIGRKRPLMTQGPGVRKKLRKGQKTRKTIVGNTLSHTISQINLKVVKYGPKSLTEILGIKEEPKKEESKKINKEEEKVKNNEEKPKEEEEKEEVEEEEKEEVEEEEKEEVEEEEKEEVEEEEKEEEKEEEEEPKEEEKEK